jgi:hypothetical protein
MLAALVLAWLAIALFHVAITIVFLLDVLTLVLLILLTVLLLSALGAALTLLVAAVLVPAATLLRTRILRISATTVPATATGLIFPFPILILLLHGASFLIRIRDSRTSDFTQEACHASLRTVNRNFRTVLRRAIALRAIVAFLFYSSHSIGSASRN